jgi:hypothetical protein
MQRLRLGGRLRKAVVRYRPRQFFVTEHYDFRSSRRLVVGATATTNRSW